MLGRDRMTWLPAPGAIKLVIGRIGANDGSSGALKVRVTLVIDFEVPVQLNCETCGGV